MSMKQSKVQRAAYLLSQLREKRERASGIVVPDLLFEKRLSVDQGLICHLRSSALSQERYLKNSNRTS